MFLYDYLIIGCGLFGSIFAYEMNKIGKKCLIIDKRNHIGGNIYSEKQFNIDIHKYGCHVFHTNEKYIWDYINQFDNFNNFILSPIAYNNGKIYNLPFNMNTFNQIFNIHNPNDAIKIINEQTLKYKNITPINLKEQALKLVGEDIFNILIKEYTEKQWGKSCDELPPSIIKRIPLRFTYNNNYFNDNFQGIPQNGYTFIIQKLIKNVDVKLNTNYFDNKKYFNSIAKKNNILWLY